MDFEKKVQELQANEEFMARIAAVKEAKEYIALFAEYGVEISEEEAEDMQKSVEEAKVDSSESVELDESDLDNVAGGFAAVYIFGYAVPKILVGTMIALVAAVGATAAYKKIKQKIKQMGL